MIMDNLIRLYEERVLAFDKEAKKGKSKYIRYSFVRLAYFIAALIVVLLIWVKWNPFIGIGLAVIFLYGFSRFIIWHQRVQQSYQHYQFLFRINQRELSALSGDHSNFAPGNDHIDTQHPYTVDLDIFGDHSLFQFCNRTSSAMGNNSLAAYLNQAAKKDEIQLRQAAIRELKDKLDWRQDFQAIGLATEDNITHISSLKSWLNDEPFVSNNRLYVFALGFIPFLVLVGIALWIFVIPWQVAILFFVPSFWILRRTLKQVNHTHQRTTYAEKMLSAYAKLIYCIEKESFKSPKLIQLHKVFQTEQKSASKHLQRLSYIIGLLNVRYNVFAIILNIFALWDLFWVYRLEKWKKQQRNKLMKWFEALGEMEALISLATLFHNNPDWTFPEFHDRQVLNAQFLGHPLISKKHCIFNTFEMPTQGHIKLITGSNMAGKSTFLRTVGINIVLANAGAPVCAKQFTLPLLAVYTSMRTQDALYQSTSSFYAELKRLKFIIDAVEQKKERQVFFLLDEILKGTNSRDRHTGAEALIKQLIKSKGAGLVATHDLELGKLEALSKGAIENLCMEVEIKEEELFFDYKIKKGVSKSFNATLLMKSMGIRVGGE